MRAFAFAALTLMALNASTADAQHDRSLPPLPDHLDVPLLGDDAYFEQDAEDPRVFRPASGFFERGFDRGYVERMARPPLPEQVLDTVDAVGFSRPSALMAPPSAPANPSWATVVRGNIIVVEGSSSTVGNTERGLIFNHNGGGLQAIINQVWSRYGDSFDFITVFTSFDDAFGGAYYLPLKNDTAGLGKCDMQAGDTFGCIFDQVGGQIQGFVFMNSLNNWQTWDWNYDGQVHPFSSFNSSVYPVLGQEVGHRWGSGLRFIDPRSGQISEALLGRDGSHWAAYVDTDASVMDGWDWEDQGDGNFRLVDDQARFSTLDLYTMGAKPVATAEPFFFIEDARFLGNAWIGAGPVPADAALQLPSVGLMESNGITTYASGTRVDLSIQDIVDAEGNRCPDADHTQRTFRQAFVLVTEPGQTAAQVTSQVASLETVRVTWEQWWQQETERELKVCTDLVGGCLQQTAALSRGDVVFEYEHLEPGDDFELVVDVSTENGALENARVLVALSGNGAEFATASSEEITLGQVADTTEVRVPISLDDDYGCGFSLKIALALESDNAPTVREEYRVFPGYRQIYAEDFDNSDGDYRVNADGLDESDSGAFVHSEVELSCDMTPRTPERDASPEGRGAWVTSLDQELDGTSSLWSDEISLDGVVSPELRFAYWLDANNDSGKVTVLLSGDGEALVEARVYDEPYHGWRLGRVILEEVFDEMPDSVEAVFEFRGNGQVEGGIDEVRVIDVVGQCVPEPGLFSFFGCSAQKAGGNQAPLLALTLMGFAALLWRRRD